MDVMTAILTRRSEHFLTDPAPSDDELAYLLRGAATAPDHGTLKPWRWILLRGNDRAVLGDCLAGEHPGQAPDRMAARMLSAPLLAVLVFAPRPNGKVPEWEQLAATSSMTHSLMLLLHARGYGSMWRTGRLAQSTAARSLLRIDPAESLLGGLWMGTPDPAKERLRRPLEDVSHRISVFRANEHAAMERISRAL
ncbi:nitroreductase family protein [Streptomyces griseorubiginosus]|uniref:nitroreductase family protein n=1 Tax=Streptomyces griseorubiginosus TaxID=67304 RepID=UPI003648606C